MAERLDAIPEPSRDGSPPAIIEIGGITFHWVGVLTWGHAPYGADPIIWECETCKGSTVSPGPHARHHTKTRRLLSRITARLGLTDEGNPE